MRYAHQLRRCLPLLGLMLPAYLATAQTTADSARVSYTEEVLTAPLQVDTTALRVQREDRDLWKLGLNNIVLSGSPTAEILSYDSFRYNRFGVHVAYERKLFRPAWSLLAEISPSALRYFTGYYFRDLRSYWTFNVRTQLAARYYYNLERRIRQGRGAGNFSGNYIALALGTGFGRYSDTPFHRFVQEGGFVHVDGALLYGMQRRIGQHGFIDINAGLTSLSGSHLSRKIDVGGSLRLGLVVGAAPVTRPYSPSIIEEDIATPRMYVGAHIGSYAYYFRDYGWGIRGPYLYVGRYILPRLALQVGGQYQHVVRKSVYQVYPSDVNFDVDQHLVALPVLVKYSLTRAFYQRVQFEAVGGGALMMSSLRSKERQVASGEVLSEKHSYRLEINPMVGLNTSYGIGRRRRVQASVEHVLFLPLQRGYYYYGVRWPNGGISIGLRYRFLYRDQAKHSANKKS